jgi:glycosyltransferase involved in cell wall biosynthesis
MDISVVIPLYNKRQTVLQALESVLNQRLKPFEVIVVNDGSTDGSEQLVEELDHPLVRLISQPNGGVSSARNKGIEVSLGDWIAFLDADDEWFPDYLETIKKLNSDYPKANVLGTAYLLKDYKGNRKRIKLNKIPFHGEEGILSNYFEVASCSHPPLWTSAVVVKKEALLAVEGFPVGIKSGEDLLTWARLAVRNRIVYNRQPHSVYVLDQSHEISQPPGRLHDMYDFIGQELIKLASKYGDKSIKKYISHWYKMRTSVFVRIYDRKNALRYSIKALKYNIFNSKIYLFIVFTFVPRFLQNVIKRTYKGLS